MNIQLDRLIQIPAYSSYIVHAGVRTQVQCTHTQILMSLWTHTYSLAMGSDRVSPLRDHWDGEGWKLKGQEGVCPWFNHRGYGNVPSRGFAYISLAHTLFPSPLCWFTQHLLLGNLDTRTRLEKTTLPRTRKCIRNILVVMNACCDACCRFTSIINEHTYVNHTGMKNFTTTPSIHNTHTARSTNYQTA